MRSSFIQLLKQIAAEEGLSVEFHSENWIVRLSKDRVSTWIYGYNFDINGSAATQICGDKNATYLCLRTAGFPAVAHLAFMDPSNSLVADYVKSTGSISGVLNYASSHDFNVVLKPLKGTGGNDVFHCRDAKQVEAAAICLFRKDYGLAISPFKVIMDEIRVVVLCGRAVLMYRKKRPSLIGDGKQSVRDLLVHALRSYEPRNVTAITRCMSSLSKTELDRVPPQGEEYHFEWRHNLGLGATAERVVDETVSDLALGAARALGMKFCSVDIVNVKNEGLMVLEVNSGVMMDSFLTSNDESRNLAKSIYTEAILASLGHTSHSLPGATF